MLGIGFRREVAAQSHRDRARRNLSKPGRDDNPGAFRQHRGSARESCGQREWHRQPVRHSNHDVAHGGRGGEMFLYMFGGRQISLLRCDNLCLKYAKWPQNRFKIKYEDVYRCAR